MVARIGAQDLAPGRLRRALITREAKQTCAVTAGCRLVDLMHEWGTQTPGSEPKDQIVLSQTVDKGRQVFQLTRCSRVTVYV